MMKMPDVIINRRPSSLAAAALEVARTQLKVLEQPLGSNDGPEVRAYLKGVGLPPGFAWCAAFVYWSFKQAAIQRDVINPLPCTGGVMALFNQAKGKHITKLEGTITPDMLRPGDIFILQWASGHCQTGIVDKISGNTIITIEGNTDSSGTRRGIGVFSKRRSVCLLGGIIRVTE